MSRAPRKSRPIPLPPPGRGRARSPIRFLGSGPIDQISGRYLYNKCVVEHLRRAGLDVCYHADVADGVPEGTPCRSLDPDSCATSPKAPRWAPFVAYHLTGLGYGIVSTLSEAPLFAESSWLSYTSFTYGTRSVS